MKPSLFALAFCLYAWPVHAQTPRKACEDLKSDIETKLQAKGVSSYSLEILAKDQETDGKVVGTCDGGTKKIVYKRTTEPAALSPADTKKQ